MAQRFQKTMIIYNPQSGLGLKWPFLKQLALGLPQSPTPKAFNQEKFLYNLEKELKIIGINPDSTIATSPELATSTAVACAKAGYDLVIAAGGDGTINAVINGLAHYNTPLAIVPAGTINLLSLQLQLPTTLEAACQKIQTGRTIKIDLGRINDRYFASLAGIGFDAFVIKQINPKHKRRFGILAYLIAALTNLFTFKFKPIEFKLDDHPKSLSGYMLIAGNVKYYGGKMILQAQATINDGKLDLCVIKKKNIFAFINYLWRLRRGELDRYLDISFFKCQEVHVLSASQHIQLDGDYFGQLTDIKITVVPHALKVIA